MAWLVGLAWLGWLVGVVVILVLPGSSGAGWPRWTWNDDARSRSSSAAWIRCASRGVAEMEMQLPP